MQKFKVAAKMARKRFLAKVVDGSAYTLWAKHFLEITVPPPFPRAFLQCTQKFKMTTKNVRKIFLAKSAI